MPQWSVFIWCILVQSGFNVPERVSKLKVWLTLLMWNSVTVVLVLLTVFTVTLIIRINFYFHILIIQCICFCYIYTFKLEKCIYIYFSWLRQNLQLLFTCFFKSSFLYFISYNKYILYLNYVTALFQRGHLHTGGAQKSSRQIWLLHCASRNWPVNHVFSRAI